jgi:hypothetical protein
MSEQTATVDGLMLLVFGYGAARCDVDRSNTAGNQRACNASIDAIRAYATRLAASPAVPQQPVATEWKMPQDQKLMQFINSTPLVMSLLYDINLLPEQIDNGRRWYYMVAVCEHMERALAALPASPAVPVQAAQAGWIPVSERMPPDDVPLLVYTPPLDGEEERIDFEWRDDGCWVEHNNCFDHYMAVTGGKGCLDDGTPCVGPAEGTPYTHWMLRPAAPSQPTEPGSQA